jgi:hypothetical protein
MQKITVVGKDSAAKKAAVIALKSNFKVIDLLPEEIEIKKINSTNLVVYINEETSIQENTERLNFNSHSAILQFQPCRPKLTNIQRKVFLQLAKGLSDKDNWISLRMCRSRYFNILEQLRSLFDVEKNWELVQLAKNKAFDHAI